MKLFFYLIIFIYCCSCMQSFKMSDRKITDYYHNSLLKPSFAYSDTSKKKIHFAYSADTTKPILLLIHGAPGAWFGYKEFFNDSLLLSKFQIIAPDRPGYNKSEQKETSIEQQALLLKCFLRLHNHQKISVLGRSYGAPIAAKLTADNPDLIENLILISPACDPLKEKFWWFSKPVNTKFARFFLPSFANRATDEKFAHKAELMKILSDWKKIKCPVTILQGGKDWIIDASNGRFVDSMLVNAPRRFIYLPENGHLLTAERYDLIRDILLKR
jgi:pimeloyl-ACP methyl ester carboxylesterase